jgi:hypothetical protein
MLKESKTKFNETLKSLQKKYSKRKFMTEIESLYNYIYSFNIDPCLLEKLAV